MSDDLIKCKAALQQEETKLKKERVATLRKAAAFMERVHQQSCFEQGNHSDEVDTYHGLACEALRFQARIVLAALEPQPIDPTAIREAALREAAGVARILGVHPELNIFGGGPEWHQHGKRIAYAIEALIGEPK